MSTETILIDAAGPVIAAAGVAYTVWSQRRKANADQLAKIEAKVDRKADAPTVADIGAKVGDVEHRVIELEARYERLPDSDTTHRLELSLAEMRGELGMLNERLKPIASIGDRLQEFLLEQGRTR